MIFFKKFNEFKNSLTNNEFSLIIRDSDGYLYQLFSANFYGLDGALKVASLPGRALESRSAMVWGSGTELSANQVKL